MGAVLAATNPTGTVKEPQAPLHGFLRRPMTPPCREAPLWECPKISGLTCYICIWDGVYGRWCIVYGIWEYPKNRGPDVIYSI